MKYFEILGFILFASCCSAQLKYEITIPHYQIGDRQIGDTTICILATDIHSSIFRYSSVGEFEVTGKVESNLGKIQLVVIDSMRKVIITGQYSDGLDTLKRQIVTNDDEGNLEYLVVKYIEPIVEGEWMYRDFENNVVFSRCYIRGAEVKCR